MHIFASYEKAAYAVFWRKKRAINRLASQKDCLSLLRTSDICVMCVHKGWSALINKTNVQHSLFFVNVLREMIF